MTLAHTQPWKKGRKACRHLFNKLRIHSSGEELPLFKSRGRFDRSKRKHISCC